MTHDEAVALRETFLAARRARFGAESQAAFVAASEAEDIAREAWQQVPRTIMDAINEAERERAYALWREKVGA